jgi:hypothetical protein
MARIASTTHTAGMTDPGTRARLVPWSAMTLLSCVIALYAAFVLLVPHFGPPFVDARRAAVGALTFAVVTLRFILPAELAAGMPLHDAYQLVAWACWVPNLIVAEWFFLRPRHREAT